MSIMRYSFVHWAALLTAVRNSPCSCPFSVSLHRPQDALNCAMSPANPAGQDGPGKIENNRMAKKKNSRLDCSFLWYPAATYLPGPSPAKYCRRTRA